MTAQDLYEEMKKVLAFFDLRFHEMDKVEVSISANGKQLIFTYVARHIAIPIK